MGEVSPLGGLGIDSASPTGSSIFSYLLPDPNLTRSLLLMYREAFFKQL